MKKEENSQGKGGKFCKPLVGICNIVIQLEKC